MKAKPHIGIIGACGDLGSQMVIQACSTFENVNIFDTQRGSRQEAHTGIDPSLLRKEALLSEPRFLTGAGEVMANSAVVHWCAPLEALADLEELPAGTLLVLHDSVMNNSLRAAERLKPRAGIHGKIAIVHCLMNPEKRVLVATESDNPDSVLAHMSDLSLSPLQMSAQEHDFVMAHSQAPFALLGQALGPLLADYGGKGLLTTSALELKHALDSRAAQWTPETIKAILSNPQLLEFMNSLSSSLEQQAKLDGTINTNE
jgi:prephenate dehydrogenase